MKISVITVVFNDVKEISHTIESVLIQDYNNIEYIVIDGGSTDGTTNVINKYVDKLSYYISEIDNGIYNAMNKGLDHATGDYVMFLNSGDILYKSNIITRMVSQLDYNVDILYGNSLIRTDGGLIKPPTFKFKKIKQHPIFRHNAALYRLPLQNKYRFDESLASVFGYGLDYNSILDMYYAGANFKGIDDVIISYNNVGISNLDARQNLIYTYRIAHKNRFSIIDYFMFKYRLMKLNLKE